MLHRRQRIPHNLIFYVLVMLYLWLVVEPRLIYQCFGTILPDAPVFLTGWSFMSNSLHLPGGFILYISGLLSQGFCYSWLGALIIILSALCLCELSRRHLAAAGYTRSAVLSSLPAILIVLIYSQYKHPLTVCLVVSLGLVWSLIFERLSLRTLVVRIIVYCLMSAVLFGLAGAGGLLIFSFMTVIYGIFVRRDFVFSALAIPVGFGIVWCFAQYVFLVLPRETFTVLTSLVPATIQGKNTFPAVLIIILYGFAPLCVFLVLLGRNVFAKFGPKPKKHSGKDKQKEQAREFTSIFRNGVKIAAPIVLMLVGLYFSYNRMRKPLIQAHDYSLRRQWDKVLELSRSLPKGASNIYFNHYVNRALYHTERLPYDMFTFPQTPHGLLLTHEKKASDLTQLKLCDIYMELGRVNTAERLATEILTARNHCGIVVEKLAWINIIKEQYETARIYLNVLQKDLVYRKRAQALLKAIDNGFSTDQKAYLDTIRSRMHQEGYLGTRDESVEQILTELLASNPTNRMAFEYLMACYLLTGQVDKIAARMAQIREFDYDGIPTLYEEALLIYFGSQGRKIDFNKSNIRRETFNRYIRFIQLRNSMRPDNRQVVLRSLISEYGSSYFFYSTFGQVGVL
ncbi:MAG: hypothetical protein JXM79_13685 [Sedimentisphaerales bacterium]|nr:hypothetical protein [Sedimentisphaerales bacterium]